MSEPVVAGRGRVLVVDDEPALAQALARHLKSAGFATEILFDGSEAETFLAREEVDVVISDIAMPGLDGVSLLRLVRGRDLDLPVILMTGTPSVESAARAVDFSATRYLIKPVDKSALVSSVEAAVRLRHLAKAKREALDLLAGGGMGVGENAALGKLFDSALSTLWVAFQPIVSWGRREIFGHEALVRTDEPSLPHPGALFDAAERLGRVAELGILIRDAAATAFKSAPGDGALFVNLHMLDLNEVSLYLPESSLARVARRVVLEITERASCDVVKNLRARAAVLRRLGYRLAIDDLGAGYAGSPRSRSSSRRWSSST